MNLFATIFGNIVYGFGWLLHRLFDLLIFVVEFFVALVSGIGRSFLVLLSMGGCFFLLLLMSPLGWIFLFNPLVFFTIVFLVAVPILGKKFVSRLKYLRYMVTEFLYDYANYLKKGEKAKYGSFKEYGSWYRHMEDERKREEYRRRQEEQRKEWEEWFRANSQSQWSSYNQQDWSGYYGGQGYQQYGPVGASNFKTQYEAACDLLGVAYDADKYEIKLAYRQKAKEYHPDLNRASDATEVFQKINQAYEFLNDENIARYKEIS